MNRLDGLEAQRPAGDHGHTLFVMPQGPAGVAAPGSMARVEAVAEIAAGDAVGSLAAPAQCHLSSVAVDHDGAHCTADRRRSNAPGGPVPQLDRNAPSQVDPEPPQRSEFGDDFVSSD